MTRDRMFNGGTTTLAQQPATEMRGARLSRSLSGTNLERAGDYNLRTVLQAVRLNRDTTRVEIARQTGLTAPTIANITGRLVQMGLIRTAGRKQGGRGQPALKLQVEPDGAFSIGLNVDRDHLTLVTLDLAGEVRSRITREVAFALPSEVVAFVEEELPGVIAAGEIDPARILGSGVAIPDDLGQIALPHQPARYSTWTGIDLQTLLHGSLAGPIHCDNDAAAAALGEAEYGSGFDNPNFFYLLVSAGLGGGLVIDRSYHRGAHGRSGEIGLMPDVDAENPLRTVQETVSTSALLARFERGGMPLANVDDPAMLAEDARGIVERWLADSARALAQPVSAIAYLFDPNAILIGGRLPMPLIERLVAALNAGLPALLQTGRVRVMPAAMAKDAPAIGAAILPFLDRLLPSDSILIQAGRIA